MGRGPATVASEYSSNCWSLLGPAPAGRALAPAYKTKCYCSPKWPRLGDQMLKRVPSGLFEPRLGHLIPTRASSYNYQSPNLARKPGETADMKKL